MLWVYGHYKYFNSFSAGIDFRRQILTSKVDPRTEMVKANLTKRPETWTLFYTDSTNKLIE